MRTGTQSVDNVNGLQWERRKESTPQLESFERNILRKKRIDEYVNENFAEFYLTPP